MLETWWRVVDGHGRYSHFLNIAHLPSFDPSESVLDSNISELPPLVSKLNLIGRISQCTICFILHNDKGPYSDHEWREMRSSDSDAGLDTIQQRSNHMKASLPMSSGAF